MTLKKIIIISLLFILTIGAVNASDDVNSLQAEPNNEISQDIISLENTYEINDANYNTYFDENGKTRIWRTEEWTWVKSAKMNVKRPQ